MRVIRLSEQESLMHIVDESKFQKVVQVIKTGPTGIAYQPVVELGFKWLTEYEGKLLQLTNEQVKTLKDLLSC